MTAQIAPPGQGMTTGGMKNKIPRGYQQGQIAQFTPEQIQLLQRRLQDIGPESFLERLSRGDEGIFDEMEEPAMRQFEQLQGNIASRFSGAGMGGSGRKSSGFQNTLGQAGSDFASQLQSQRLALQQQAQRDLGEMSSNLLGQRPYEQFLTKKQPSFLQNLAAGSAPVAGAAIGGYFGGVPGAAAGGKIGSQFGQAFLG